MSKGTLILWLRRKSEKVRRPERGAKKIVIGDLIKARVSEKDFMILREVGRFFGAEGF